MDTKKLLIAIAIQSKGDYDTQMELIYSKRRMPGKRAIEKAEKADAIVYGSPEYPEWLTEYHRFPLVLFVRKRVGNLDLSVQPDVRVENETHKAMAKDAGKSYVYRDGAEFHIVDRNGNELVVSEWPDGNETDNRIGPREAFMEAMLAKNAFIGPHINHSNLNTYYIFRYFRENKGIAFVEPNMGDRQVRSLLQEFGAYPLTADCQELQEFLAA